jgi:hypothetical protein
MSTRLSLAALIVCLAVPTAAHAGEDSQVWTSSNLTVKLDDRWRLSQEVTLRFSDNRNGLYEVESNSLVGYRFGKTATFWAGSTHDPIYSEGHRTAMEQRAREQVTIDNVARVGPGAISLRLRTEQRWRDTGNGTGWRARPFVRYSIPLQKGARTALVFTSEAFFNLNRTSFQTVRGLERVRNLVGVSTPLFTHATLEVGYLNQHGFVRGGADTSDNIASVQVNFSL